MLEKEDIFRLLGDDIYKAPSKIQLHLIDLIEMFAPYKFEGTTYKSAFDYMEDNIDYWLDGISVKKENTRMAKYAEKRRLIEEENSYQGSLDILFHYASPVCDNMFSEEAYQEIISARDNLQELINKWGDK